MAELADMPMEIVQLILQYSKESLASLTRVCKSMHGFSQPLLYEEILIMGDRGEDAYVCIDLLLRTVLERPTLASLVRRIQFWSNELRRKPIAYRLSRATTNLARITILLDEFPDLDMWMEDIQKGGSSVAVALLLSQLHAIETVELGEIFQNHFLGLMFEQALSYVGSSKRMSTFRHLKQIELDPGAFSPRAGALKLDDMKSMFMLPSMQNVSFSITDMDTFSGHGLRSTTLRSLSLYNSQIREESLGQILAIVPNLKSLNCCLWHDPQPFHGHDFRSPFLDCELLGQALKHTRSIEHLSISIKFFTYTALEVDWGGAYEEGEEWGIKGNIGSLTHLKHLKSLEIPTVVLQGWVVSEFSPILADVLPRSLNHLLLRNDLNYFYKYEWNQEACLELLAEYMVALKPRSANLEKITVKLKDCAPDERWSQDAYDKLRLICGEAKVLCSFDPPTVGTIR